MLLTFDCDVVVFCFCLLLVQPGARQQRRAPDKGDDAAGQVHRREGKLRPLPWVKLSILEVFLLFFYYYVYSMQNIFQRTPWGTLRRDCVFRSSCVRWWIRRPLILSDVRVRFTTTP